MQAGLAGNQGKRKALPRKIGFEEKFLKDRGRALRMSHVMQLQGFIFTLVLSVTGFAGTVFADREKLPPRQWEPAFSQPGFATVEGFTDHLQSGAEPWRDLLIPDPAPPGAAAKNGAKEMQVEDAVIVHRSKDAAIVFARNKTNRTAPFCAVVFLLTRTGDRFHVTDFVRRSENSGSYSDVVAPRLLKLDPSFGVHFYFMDLLGGRRWGFDTLEFFAVKGGKLHPTLLLKNVGAYLSPARPYREFFQSAEVAVFRGQPRLMIERIWAMEGEEGDDERRQEFAVDFRWDRRAEKFVGPRTEVVSLKEPETWTGEGLPAPPERSVARK
jgi:hypothetical protein